MNKPSTISPLFAIEEFMYDKLKDKPFRLWHYLVALSFLCIVPLLFPSTWYQSNMFFVIFIITSLAWSSSRVAGRVLSRNTNTDSVLIYRFFATVPWLVSAITLGLSLLLQHLSELDTLLFSAFFWLAVLVSVMHILGIGIHIFKKDKTIKNIKKTDLFQ